jgi:2-hydroxychromene-2-carboxylate isomerase
MKVEFHFDFGSPNAYLAHLVIPEIERRTGAKFEYVSVLLGGIFKLAGNRSPVEAFAAIKNKLDCERLETARFIRRHGIEDFQPNPFFSGQHTDADARRHRGAEARCFRALRRRDVPAHVVGSQKAR